MKRLLSSFALALVLAPSWAHAQNLAPEAITATVLIANYDEEDNFVGWGSGFYVDEGIVVTNRHVIDGGDWYRVYASNEDGTLNLQCYKNITRSDVKINLDDDVAYMRAYLPCDHDVLRFAHDPYVGDTLWVIGFPYNGTTSLRQTVSTGSVLNASDDDWYHTDAHLDVGNSGGPVVDGEEVLGVAVAKGVDSDGNYVVGFFIPSSVIIRGLLYANDPRFGYTPQDDLPSSRSSSPSLSSSVRSDSSSSRTSSRSSSSVSSRRSSSSSSRMVSPFRDLSPLRPGYEAILSLHERDIIGGYPDGTYRPERGINRAEFVKILVAAFRSEAIYGDTHCFSDVADEWFAPYVCAAKRLGWIGGYPDGTFRPAQQVNRAEAMKIVIEALGDDALTQSSRLPSDVRGDTWFLPYVAYGVTLGIVDPDRRFRADQMLTREHAAVWIEGAE